MTCVRKPAPTPKPRRRAPAEVTELAGHAPGSGLVEALEQVDGPVVGHAAPAVLTAVWRQRNHDDALFLAAVHDLGMVYDPDTRLRATEPDEFSADETAKALVVSRRQAQEWFGLAHGLLTRLRPVYRALHDGDLDLPRARAFHLGTRHLDPGAALEVAEALLPEAPGLLRQDLEDRIREWAIALDADAEARRTREAERQAWVFTRRRPDGTADLVGANLPGADVAFSDARLRALARAAKRAGVRTPVDLLASRLYLRLLDGTYATLTDHEIVASLLADQADADRADDSDRPETPDDPEEDGAPADRPRTVAVPLELRARLTTLLGLDDHPGELCGRGPLHPAELRDLVAQHLSGSWRWVLTDLDGRLLSHGLTRRRPRRPGRHPGRTGRGRATVEIAVPIPVLRSIDPDAHPAWAALLRELRGHAEAYTRGVLITNPDGPTAHGADAARRRADSALDRGVRARDRRCRGYACRAPVHAAEIDHTVEHHRGGATRHDNLGGHCHHDHALKTRGGWTLSQPSPGEFHWTSRAGARYVTRPEPVLRALPLPRATQAGHRHRGDADGDDPPF